MLFGRIVKFYAEGFRNMTLGRTLWCIILIKLFIMFASYLQGEDGEKQEQVSCELTGRAATESDNGTD